MKRLLALTIIIALSACGGGSATRSNNYGNANGTDYFKNTLTKEGAYFITRDEYPDLYEAIIKRDSDTMFRLLGYPSSLSYGTSSTSKAIYIQTGKPASEVYTRTRNSLLYYSMRKGDLEKVAYFLSEGADPNNINGRGNTPLHRVLSRDEEMPNTLALVRILLEKGADPDTKGEYDMTPLHKALHKDNQTTDTPALLQALLEAGADPNAKDGYGLTPLHMVLSRDNPSPYFFSSTPKEEDTQPKPDTLALVQMLLEAGADPNAKNKTGQTALHAALSSELADKTGTVRTLMAHGADPDIKDSSDQTALHATLKLIAKGGESINEDEAIVWLGLIITADTDLDARNKRGKTPLALAFFGGKKKIEEYLLAKGSTDYGIKNNSFDFPKEENISSLGFSSSEIIALNREQCSFVLKEYDVKFEHLSDIKGVQIPIRLTSPIGGIKYRHTHGSKKFSIVDCRLAVTLIGWAPVLREHHVKEVVHMRMYSPGARVGGGTKISGHNYALAIDAAHFIMDDGTELEMNTGWTDRRYRTDPCEPPKAGDSGAQKTLRAIACDTGKFDLFSVILTPHYNKAHYDHLHMELTEDQYMYVR